MKILSGPPISPDSARTHWYATVPDTRTDGLCHDYGTNPGICSAPGVRPRSPEIKELARALKYDPDLIYEYLRNAVDTEFLFGAHKGSLGVVVDHSGTAFDQAELMVDLLRESGKPARFKFGAVSLTAKEFEDWTGLTRAQAACELLATGGVPAVINNTEAASCADYGGAPITAVTMAHVWVEADLSGGTYFFDPSYKAYLHKTGIDVAHEAGVDAEDTLAVATAGMHAGTDGSGATAANYVDSLNASALQDHLKTYTGNLLTRFSAADLQGADMTDVIGGRLIVPVVRPSGGWRQVRPSNYAEAETWNCDSAPEICSVPDKYRAKLTLTSAQDLSNGVQAVYVQASLFADEIYGRRLELGSESAADGPNATTVWHPVLSFDGVPVFRGYGLPDQGHLSLNLTITADHPFAAKATPELTVYGGYADSTVTKVVDALLPAAIVHGWGRTSSSLVTKWEREQAVDKVGAQFLNGLETDNIGSASGDLLRARVAATWLAQFSSEAEINAELANARSVLLHTVGVISSIQTSISLPPEPGPDSFINAQGFYLLDETAVVDLESSFGVVSRVSDASARRGAAHVIAAAAATLEGNVLSQLTDSPDAASTATRLAWGNKPESSFESYDTSSRRVYRFPARPQGSTAQTAADALAESIVRFENGTTGVPAWNYVSAIPQSQVDFMRGRLAGTIRGYVDAGFEVVGSNEALLGPGDRKGSEYPSITYNLNNNVDPNWFDHPVVCDTGPMTETEEVLFPLYCTLRNQSGQGNPNPHTEYERLVSLQRGGALIATRYADGPDDPVEIAHVLTRYGPPTKGGGAPSVSQTTAFDPGTPANTLKDRFVDRSSALGVDLASGQSGFATRTLASKGAGEFPYLLESRIELRGGVIRPPARYTTETYGALDPNSDPRVSNWQGEVQVSNSGVEAMGASRIEAAAPTLAAFAAAQAVWRKPRSAERELTGALIADWWGQRLLFNVVTVMQGASAEQFVRIGLDTPGQESVFIPCAGGAARVVISGSRGLRRPLRPNTKDAATGTGDRQLESVLRAWEYSGLTIRVDGGQGDRREYAYQGQFVTTSTNTPPDPYYARVHDHRIFRLSRWTFPQGVTLTPDYQFNWAAPVRISSSFGLTLDLPSFGGTTAWHSGTLACTEPLLATDAAGAVTRLEFRAQQTRTLTRRGDDACRPLRVWYPENTSAASLQFAYDSLGRIKEASDAIAVATPSERDPHQFFIADGYRGERIDPVHPVHGAYAVETLMGGRLRRNIDELGFVTTTLRDGRGRTLFHLFPEGNRTCFAYDARDNTTEVRQVAKSAAAAANPTGEVLNLLADGETCAPAALDFHRVTAAWDPTWNKPQLVTDARGYTTAFEYVPSGVAGASLVRKVTRPAVNGQSPVYAFEYDAFGQVTKTTDPTGVVVQNTYDASSHFLATTTLDPGAGHVASTTTYTTNAVGDVISVTDPRGNIADTTWDIMRRKRIEIAPDPDGATPYVRPMVRHSYDLAGRETMTERGQGSASDGSDFGRLEISSSVEYDPAGNRVKLTTPVNVTQFSYDGMNRPVCTAVRMSPANYGSLPANVCAGAGDRITQNEWGAAGQLAKVVRGLDSGSVQNYATYEYTPNGKQKSVKDANGNLTGYHYDPFDRLDLTNFPVTGLGQGESSPTDYESYGYDENDNRTSLRKRDGKLFAYEYDALNRETVKRVPDGGPASLADDVFTEYDLAGRVRHVSFGANSGLGDPALVTACATRTTDLDSCYDTAGRLIKQVSAGRALAYGYDAASNRTRVTWPDTDYFAGYVYDALNRVTAVNEKGATSGLGLLARFTYDALGRRESLVRGNGTSTSYGYDVGSRLTSLSHAVAGSTYNVTWNFTYNPAGQVLSRTQSNDAYLWGNHPSASNPKTYDGLNRDAAIAAVAGGYDANQNLTKDATRTFVYDAENRLTSATGTGTTAALSLAYDPLGRLQQTVAGGDTSTRFLYDGPDLVAEYDDAGVLLRRYVHGTGVDEPLVWYEGAGTADARWLHADRQGSVVAQSDPNGVVTKVYAYGPYGEPNAWGGSRFAYTGQTALPEARLYHYKARVYDPATGRFLQTDPIGYKDDLAAYVYAAVDPLNRADPTGLASAKKNDAVVIVYVNGWPVAEIPVNVSEAARAAICRVRVCSEGFADRDKARAKEQEEESAAAAELLRVRACRKKCIDQYVDDPELLPGFGRNYSDRLQRCIHQCIDELRAEEEKEKDRNNPVNDNNRGPKWVVPTRGEPEGGGQDH